MKRNDSTLEISLQTPPAEAAFRVFLSIVLVFGLMLPSGAVEGAWADDGQDVSVDDSASCTDADGETATDTDTDDAGADVWDGSSDTSWYSADAEEFTITTPEQLAGVATLVNEQGVTFEGQTILLGCDIYLNADGSVPTSALPSDGTTYADDEDLNSWTPISEAHESSTKLHFYGTFDGQGHSIYNIYCPLDIESEYAGLFGYLDTGSCVQNLAVTGLVQGRVTGGIAASFHNDADGEAPVIRNCINYCTVRGDGSGTRGAGGILGGFSTVGGSVENCINFGTIYNSYRPAGGIVGVCTEQTVSNCYNVGDVSSASGDSWEGAITATLNDAVIENCYWLSGSSSYGCAYPSTAEGTTEVTSTELASADMPNKLNVGGRWFLYDAEGVNGGYPILSWQGSLSAEDGTLVSVVVQTDPCTEYLDGQYFDASGMTAIATYADGATVTLVDFTPSLTDALELEDDGTTVTLSIDYEGGSYSFPYVISVSASALSEMSIKTEPDKLLYSEGDELDLEGLAVTVSYTNGTSTTFSDDEIDEENGFSVEPSGALDLEDDGSAITVSYSYRGQTLSVATTSTIEVEDGLQTDEDGVYQISDASDLELFTQLVYDGAYDADAVLLADIDLSSFGEEWQHIGRSSSKSYSGEFDGAGHTVTMAGADALFGYISGSVHDLVTAGETTKAGLANYLVDGAVIEDCVNEADVTGTSVAGGFAQRVNGDASFIDCVNLGDVTSSQSSIGGIVGYHSDGTLDFLRCVNRGAITGRYAVGGIVGWLNQGSIVDTYSNATIASTRSSTTYFGVGGIVGRIFSSTKVSLENCYAAGCMDSSGTATGGLVGYGPEADIFSNCYWRSCLAEEGIGSYADGEIDEDELVEVSASQLQSAEMVALLNGEGGTAWASDDAEAPFNDGYPVLSWEDADLMAGFESNDEEPTEISGAQVTLSGSVFAYTGEAIEPAVTVVLDGVELVAGTDYTVEYSDNVEAGTATVTVTGTGDYCRSVTVTFEIEMTDISGAELSLESDSLSYTGSALEPAVSVVLDGVVLVEGSDYEVSYADNVEVGTATVTVTGIGACTGSLTASFQIVEADVSGAELSLESDSLSYAGSALEPAVSVVLDGVVLVEGSDYELSYADNVELGTATVTVTGIGSYKGVATTNFQIVAADIAEAEFSFDSEFYDYTGEAIVPSVSLSLDGVVLVEGVDYTIEFSDNVDAGTATATASGMGNYTGTATAGFYIASISIRDAVVSLDSSSFEYTGSAIEPEVGVTVDGVALVEGEDYAVSFAENVEVGTATVTITGIGNYAGTATASFEIVAAAEEEEEEGDAGDAGGDAGDGGDGDASGDAGSGDSSGDAGSGDSSGDAGDGDVESDDGSEGDGAGEGESGDESEAFLFDDVQNEGSYYFEAVYALYDEGYITGYAGGSIYGVGDGMTRVQVVNILWRMAGSPEATYVDGTFSDVSSDKYYASAVAWAWEEGVTTGTEEGDFLPNDSITCQEMFVMVARYINGGTSVAAADADGTLSAFKDAAEVNSYAEEAVAWCVENGLVTGTDSGEIEPQDELTREMGATVLFRSVSEGLL